ncbi:DUF2235 domain-containing protein [Tateyamaria sp.]|uniref:DUF2235 domain-containing protein n=1 Tax=Tateyamaria sp. TaxID=1929288 RepID=UPI003B21B423
MTAIAIFCDGTWNNKDRTENDTSVARIFQALETEKNRGRRGVDPLYVEGVGADNEAQSLGKFINKWRGGALGRGLTANVRKAYAHLCATYKAGDRIYIFGFSRGAYTARSLAGLIRASGLVRDPDDINKAMAHYRNRHDSTKPSTPESLAFRAEKSPDFYTNEDEREWRRDNNKPIGAAIHIAYLGIFDTVGTRGIPGVLSQLGLIPGGHGFHDLELSSMVQSGRHALGLDERRRLYKHTEWSNLKRLNDAAGVNSAGHTRYLQQWFPGDHGMIGGSGANRQISNSIMAWVLEGAAQEGLSVAMPSVVAPKSDDYAGPLSNKSGGWNWARGWRSGPAAEALMDVHDVALKRVREVRKYRPKSLKILDVPSWEAKVDTELSTRIV